MNSYQFDSSLGLNVDSMLSHCVEKSRTQNQINDKMQKTYCICGESYDATRFMIQCDGCKDWFHGSCVGIKEYHAQDIDKYHCQRCEEFYGPSVDKPVVNWHRHDLWDPDATGKPVQTGTAVFIRELRTRHFAPEGEVVIHVPGYQLTESYLTVNGFSCPIVVNEPEGLGMRMPPENFDITNITQYLGSSREIEVIDVMRQENIKMNISDFVQYYKNKNRKQVLNCISLEFSDTLMSSLVETPQVIRSLDWVSTCWPNDPTDDAYSKRPRVQKYCLLGTKNSFTDFHIDFGGSSVWYHVFRGEKIFYLIRPTPANLTLFCRWNNSRTQSETFFGDQVDKCYKCIIKKGQTMFIPTGWIHAVYTPVDSIVFGGNFLHSLNVPMQLQIYDIEKKIKISDQFKFPLFETINWYAAKRLMLELRDLNIREKKCPNNFLRGLKELLACLKQWNADKDYNLSNRELIPDTINSHKLLKDLSKEIRHADRYLMSLNPPKPERESKRKKKRPMNKDFVDFSQPQKTQLILDEYKQVHSKANLPSNSFLSNRPVVLSLPKPFTYPYGHPSLSEVRNTDTVHETKQRSWEEALAALPVVNPHPDVTFDGPRYVTEKVGPKSAPSPVVDSATAVHKGGAVLRFTLGYKDEKPNQTVLPVPPSYAQTSEEFLSSILKETCTNQVEKKSVYDFHDGTSSDNESRDEFDMVIDDSPRKKAKSSTEPAGMLKMRIASATSKQNSLQPRIPESEVDIPKNGIESLLKASAFTNRIDSVPASPSTQEAIAGMLSIGQMYSSQSSQFSTDSGVDVTPKRRRRRSPVPEEEVAENISNVHQDDEYIYPSLDNSDDEDYHIFKPRGRTKVDEAWNPKARVGPLLPKMNRPAREGTKRQAVEKVLEAAAAKRASVPDILESPQKRPYHRKKPKPSPGCLPSSSRPFNKTVGPKPNPILSSLTKPADKVSKGRKGFKTAKQRLGKILKIHKMIH